MRDAHESTDDVTRLAGWQPVAAGLRSVGDGFWRAADDASLSYPSEHHDRYAAIEEQSFWFRHRSRCIVACARRHRPDGPIVDVGGGNGFVSMGLRDAGFDTVVVEPGPDGARNAWQRGLRPVVCAPLERAGFAPRSVPAIGIFDVLEHIEDDRGFLRGIAGTLRPGGYLFLTVPAYRWLWSTEDALAGHFRRYTLRMLRERLGASGFDVPYATYMFAWLPLPVLLRRTLPSALGLVREQDGTRAASQHALPAGAVGSALEGLLEREHARIARGEVVPVGGSCLVVAQAR